MLYLAEGKWLLLLWVGLLYTVVVRVTLGPGKTRVSRKGKAPSSLGSSMVN